MLISRSIESEILARLTPGKVVVLTGPRRVGKTVLLNQLVEKLNEPYLLLNGEDFAVAESLARRSVQHYRNLLEGCKLLLIDEAQKIPEIGSILKLMVDELEDVKIIVTGSSAFEMENQTGEPLTGRKLSFRLFTLSERELEQTESPIEKRDNLRQRLIYGNYPELLQISSQKEKTEYLKELANAYLLKDILAFENIRNSDKILKLLRLIAFQIGSTVSYSELGSQLSMSKNTVERYLDLLRKVFVLHKLGGFSRNLRKEISKSSKWYFYDNGLRNILIANMNPVEIRNDTGVLWENYIIAERLKVQMYDNAIVNNYFWRTYDHQEIDWIEEREGKLFAHEFKWSPATKVKPPVGWSKNYPDAEFLSIDRENYTDWLNE